MGFSKVLFSKVHGVVLNNGKPVPNVVVKRFFNFGWTNEEKTDTTKTDKDGNFDFPIITRFSLATSVVPHEPSIAQTINVDFEGKDYLLWAFTKSNYDENGELKGKAIDLICELTREPAYDKASGVVGNCKIK